jgi:hypothetical protein
VRRNKITTIKKRGAAMTLNKFQSGFDQTQTFKSFGAEISVRVEDGREALGINAHKRAATMQPASNA